MTNEQILEEVKRIKEKSIAYQKSLVLERLVNGKMKMDESTTSYISDKFLDELFRDTSKGLGFEYENKP